MLLTIAIAVLGKRSAYLVISANPSKCDQMKVCTVYALSIATAWILVLYLKGIFREQRDKIDRTLCELILFENTMLLARLVFSFLKFTLSIWCLCTNNDFRVKFGSYPLVKNVCLALNFGVVLRTTVGVCDVVQSVVFLLRYFLWNLLRLPGAHFPLSQQIQSE